MKLISKINRKYALFSFLILLAGLILIYLFMKYFLAAEVDEKLETTKWNIIKNIKNGYNVEFSPFIEINELAKENNNNPQEVKDTLLYNKAENDYDLYRQLKTVYTNNGKSYLIIIRTDSYEQSDLLFSISIPLAIILLFIIIASNIVVREINSSIWKPFYKNLGKLKTYSVKDKEGLSLIDTDIEEFHDLNNSLTELTQKLKRDYNNMKEFSENASHELQTPIAIIKAKIEALMQSYKLDWDIASQLQVINETVGRLARINKSLTLLTKLDSAEYEEKKIISMKSILQKKVDDFIEIAESKRIEIDLNIIEDYYLLINEDILDLLFSNLISNSIRHNIEKGKIIIELNKNTFTISNTGIPLDREPIMMFERFVKGNPSNDSSGLGLAVVNQICAQYRIKIEYTVNDEWHKIKLAFNRTNHISC